MTIIFIEINEGQLLIAGIILLVLIINLYSKITNAKKQADEIKNQKDKEINDIKRQAQNDFQLKVNEQTAIFKKQEAELKVQYQNWALNELEKFKKTEVETIKKNAEELSLKAAANVLQQWKIEEEAKIRQDAISRSYAVNLGKISEHLVPFHGKFPFNPNDARFVGSPIDLLIFDGASENRDDINVYFAEIKTGKSKLTEVQKKIQAAIENKRTYWIQINPDNENFIQDDNKTSKDKIIEILNKIKAKTSL